MCNVCTYLYCQKQLTLILVMFYYPERQAPGTFWGGQSLTGQGIIEKSHWIRVLKYEQGIDRQRDMYRIIMEEKQLGGIGESVNENWPNNQFVQDYFYYKNVNNLFLGKILIFLNIDWRPLSHVRHNTHNPGKKWEACLLR